MKVFISQFMGQRSIEDILKERQPVENMLRMKGYEILNSIVEDEPNNDVKTTGLWYIGKSLEVMSYADVVFFMKGWQQGSGCKIERQAAEEYNLKILEQ